MKKITVCLLMVVFSMVIFSGVLQAKQSEFPERGWHKGPYIGISGGMMQATNDKHVVTGRSFDGAIDAAVGLTFGWDIADWIGPMMQITYGMATGAVGNGGAAVGAYPAGTFPDENARQHVFDFGLFARATHPYFLTASWQPKSVKIVPYAKLGGVGYGMYVNAPTSANKTGAFGGGPAIGLGCEFLLWKGLFFSLDLNENFIIQKSYWKTIAGVNTKVVEGGFKPQFLMLGLVGWHF